MFDQIFSTLAPIITVIIAGYLLGRFISIDVRQLTDVSLYIFTSALVLYTLVHTQLSATNILLMGSAIVILYILLAFFGIIIGNIRNYPPDLLSASLLCILFVNSGNMGLPFNLFAYGEQGLQIASIYLVFNAILMHSFGIFIAAKGRQTTWKALSAVFKLPLIHAVVLAVVVRLFHIH